MAAANPNLKRTGIFIVGLLLFRLIWAGWFAAATPLWESYDEISHYYVVRYRGGISDERPDLALPPEYQIFNQFDQPPLYHILVGLIVRAVDDGASLPVTSNPAPFCAYPQGNHLFIHDLPEETPRNSTFRGIWLARGVTLLIGAISVGVVWLAGRALWPYYPERAWLAAALYATFSPAVALSAWLNNDAPLMLLGGLVLLLLARWQTLGANRRTIGLLAAVCVIGLGIKLTMLAVIPAILWVAVDSVRRRAEKRPLKRIVLLAGGLLLLFSLVFFVLVGLCGSGLCRTHRALTPANFAAVTQDFIGNYMPEALGHLVRTLGAPAINPAYPIPLWIVALTTVIWVVGIINALMRAWEAPFERRPVALLLSLLVGAVGLGLVRVWWLKVPFMPARYIAVALPALMLLIAVGYHLLAARLHWIMGIIPLLAFVGVGILAVQAGYRPLWQLPEQRKVLPLEATPLDMEFENGLRAAGYVIDGNTVSLYLTTESQQTEPFAIEIALLDSEGRALSHCEMLAGHPLLPTNQWQPGQYVLQRARLDGLANSPQPLFIRIRFAPLLSAIYLDNQPDYTRELQPLTGTNLIPVLR